MKRLVLLVLWAFASLATTVEAGGPRKTDHDERIAAPRAPPRVPRITPMHPAPACFPLLDPANDESDTWENGQKAA